MPIFHPSKLILSPWVRTLGFAALTAYLCLAAIAFSPTALERYQESLGVERNSEAIRAQPLSFFRYYGHFSGDANYFFAYGTRMTGKRVSPREEQLHREIAPISNDSYRKQGPLLPYRDFECHYPNLAVGYFAILALIADDFDAFFHLLRLTQLMALGATALLAYRAMRLVGGEINLSDFLAVLGLMLIAIGPRVLGGFDGLPALATAVMLIAGLRSNWVVAGCASACGIFLKVYPMILVPFLVWTAFRKGRLRAVATYVAALVFTSLTVLLPWLVGAPERALSSFLSQGGRLYTEYASGPGGLLILAGQFGLAEITFGSEMEGLVLVSDGSWVIRALAVKVTAGLLVGLFLWFAYFERDARKLELPRAGARILVLAFLAAIAIALAVLPLFSPQFVVWLLPLAVAASGIRPGFGWVYIVICGITQLIFPFAHSLSGSFQQSVWAVLLPLRTSVLVFTVVVCVQSISSLSKKPPQSVPQLSA